MKICRFQSGSTARVGLIENENVHPLKGAPSLLDALAGKAEREDVLPLTGIKLLCPLPEPRNIFCAAGNYYEHVQEAGFERPDKSTYSPRFFLKPRGVLTGPDERLLIPKISPDQIDWECELAVLIGKRARMMSADEANDAIAGFTIFNDFSDRNFKLNANRKEGSWDPFFDWLHGKWHDTFGALGPIVISRDELRENFADTRVALTVNGEPRQDSTLCSMIFSPAELIASLSRIVTLEPGDIIATGTPGGVAAGGTGSYLKPGDVVEASITGIGTLRTMVEAEA